MFASLAMLVYRLLVEAPATNPDTLTRLNLVIKILSDNAHTIGLTIALLFGSVNAIAIMMDNDSSPAGRAERWDRLRKVFLCAVIIAGLGGFLKLAQDFGGIISPPVA